jgi:hypothetical protein
MWGRTQGKRDRRRLRRGRSESLAQPGPVPPVVGMLKASCHCGAGDSRSEGRRARSGGRPRRATRSRVGCRDGSRRRAADCVDPHGVGPGVHGPNLHRRDLRRRPHGRGGRAVCRGPRVQRRPWRDAQRRAVGRSRDRPPCGTTDTNNRLGVSTDFIGQNHDYPEASYKRREEIVARHRLYQQGLMWTLANHPRVPDDPPGGVAVGHVP